MKLKFIFAETADKEVVRIRSMEELLEELGYCYDSSAFCYQTFISNIGQEPNDVCIADVVEALCTWCDTELLTVSGNSEESRFQDWIDVVSLIPNNTITTINRGNRVVAFMTLPTIKAYQHEDVYVG